MSKELEEAKNLRVSVTFRCCHNCRHANTDVTPVGHACMRPHGFRFYTMGDGSSGANSHVCDRWEADPNNANIKALTKEE